MAIDPARAKELFLAAADIANAAERAAYLDRECPDPELRARVEALLAADAVQPMEPVTQSIHGEGSTVTHHPGRQPEPLIAGRYKLLQMIGEGGMGTVWLAEQTEPVKRKVAVKLIRVERSSSATILARFEAERQAIALMDHPHIAKLLDAGKTETGAPYFVMELVKGVPLNEYCDTHRLSVPERLQLFMQICSAVQHAHQKGIIHRDLKPSNILVESHDGKPTPKVIDFGLAKATSGMQLTEHSMYTAFGSVLGTPLYMAPEQASFNAVDIDTRADVYALGVILYELLTGTTPITRETLKQAALDEVLRIVREHESPTPSSRLSSADNGPSVAANRQSEPAKLGRFVKGELDWIVLKALAKDRDRRYETANGFARDIERFLNHEPVQAGPPGARYRVKKFVQRHRGQVLAASLILCALLAGIIGTTWAMLKARHAEATTSQALHDLSEEQGRTQQALNKVTEEQERTTKALHAEQQAKQAESSARREADTNADLAQKRYYASQINLASQALAAQQPARVLDMLGSLVPQAGSKDYRTWEWYHLWHEVNADLRMVVSLRPNYAHAFQYSVDGKMIIASHGVSVRFIDTATGRDRFPAQPAYGAAILCCLGVAPDGRHAASGSFLGHITIWDVQTGRAIKQWKEKGATRQITWRPNSRQVVTSVANPKRLVFRDSQTFEHLYDFAVPDIDIDQFHQFYFSPDGKQLACRVGKGMKLYDLSGGKPVLVDHIHPQSDCRAAAWSPDGSVLAIATWASVVRWDIANKRERSRFPTMLSTMAFTPDGKQLIGLNEGRREVQVWDVATGQLLARRAHQGIPNALAIHPKGTEWASSVANRELKFWNPPSEMTPPNPLTLFTEGQRRFAHDNEYDVILEAGLRAAVPDRTKVPGFPYAHFPEQRVWITIERGEGNYDKLHVVQEGTGKVVQTENWFTNRQYMAFVYSRTRAPMLVTARQTWYWNNAKEQAVILWDVVDGRLRRRDDFKIPNSCVGVGLSPDGQALVVGASDGVVRVFDTQTSKEIKVLRQRHTGFAHTNWVSFSPDGQLIAACDATNTVQVWEWPSGRLRATLRGHVGSPLYPTFFPDGQTLATSAQDGTILWDLDTQQQRLTLPPMRHLHLSPDGRTLFGSNIQQTFVFRSAPAKFFPAEVPAPKLVKPQTFAELDAHVRNLLGRGLHDEIRPYIETHRALLEQPLAGNESARRADYWMLLGEYARARQELLRQWTTSAKDVATGYRLALLQAILGDEVGYERTCRDLLQVLDQVPSAADRERVFWSCVVAPLPAELAKQAYARFQAIDPNGPTNQREHLCQAALAFRTGQAKTALALLQESPPVPDEMPIRHRGLYDYLFALFQHHVQPRMVNTAVFSRWTAARDQQLRDEIGNPLNWPPLLEMYLVRREAMQAVNPPLELSTTSPEDVMARLDAKIRRPAYPLTPSSGFVHHHHEIHGADLPTLQHWFENLPDKYRTVSVNAEVGATEKRFNAVAIDDGRKVLSLVKLDLLEGDRAADMKRMYGAGWSLAHTLFYDVAEGQSRYLHLWFKDGKQRESQWGERKDLAKHLATFKEKGLCPTFITVSDGHQTMWAEPDEGRAWELHIDLTEEQLQAKLADARKRQWRPSVLVRSTTGPKFLYGLVLVDNTNKLPWEVHLRLSTDEYERKLVDLRSNSFRPAQVVSAFVEGQTRYSVVWLGDMKATPPPK